MAHYIDKDAVVAEIKKLSAYLDSRHVQRLIEKILFIIDTIEVKEVDLEEKACDAYCKVCGHYAHTTPNHICRQACDYYKNFVNYLKGK